MKDVLYYCSGCSYRSSTTQGLIGGKGKGCASCGKSGYKCPKCGMPMKSRKANYTKSPVNQQIEQIKEMNNNAKIETGKQSQSGRKFNIRRT
jgi:uncharacterized C2H2 Zn-finger protein